MIVELALEAANKADIGTVYLTISGGSASFFSQSHLGQIG
jgi:hypothetical protein